MKRCIIRERGIFRPRVYWFEYIDDNSVMLRLNNEMVGRIDRISISDIYILDDDVPVVKTDDRHYYVSHEHFNDVLTKANVGGAN